MNTGVRFELTDISVEDVYKALSSIPASKATGIDGVNARLLKDGSTQIANVVAFIMNLSISCRIFLQPGKLLR